MAGAAMIELAYNVFRCWVSEYTALVELSGSGSDVCFESIRIETEGWQRDPAVVAPPQS